MNTQNNAQNVNNNSNILQGPVSSISSGSVTYGNIHNGRGTISSANTYTFRVRNIPASFLTKQNLNIDTGDFVTAVGNMKSGTFEVTALRNESTGAVIEPPSGMFIVIGSFFLLFGILTLIILIGIILLPIGAWCLWLGIKNSNASSQLRSIPRHSPSTMKIEKLNSTELISNNTLTPSIDASPTVNVIAEIERLFQMKENGVISNDEFAALKANILKNK